MSIPAISRSSSIDSLQRREHGLEVAELQQSLNAARGYDRLVVDGVFGPKTRAELQRFQRSMNLAPTGYPDAPTVEYLEREASLATDGKDSLAGPRPTSHSAPARPTPTTAWDRYARVKDRALGFGDVGHTAGRVATGTLDGVLDLPADAARVVERTGGGLGLLGSERLNEIATQNAELAGAIGSVVKHPSVAAKAMVKAMVIDSFARLQGKDGIRVAGAAVGRIVAEYGGDEFVERLTEQLLTNGAGEQLLKHFEEALGIKLHAAGGLVTALKITAEVQNTLAKAGDASARLAKENPELWRYLDGSALGGQPIQNLHMLWFLPEPLMDEIDAVVRGAADDRVSAQR